MNTSRYCQIISIIVNSQSILLISVFGSEIKLARCAVLLAIYAPRINYNVLLGISLRMCLTDSSSAFVAVNAVERGVSEVDYTLNFISSEDFISHTCNAGR